ncbi:MAG: hypothetical protein JW729_02700 [Bacteroidales bacterium]|nr:hypothetical protein [Bacteroidales bacterium]
MIIKKLKRFVFFATLLMPFLALAQGQTTSPYSFFGIGDTYEQGNIRNFGMGGASMAVRSNIYINFSNPASLIGIDSMSFVANAGIQSTTASYRTNEQTSKFGSTTVNHLAFALPITRWWKSSFSILPYSTIGYEVQEDQVLDFNVLSRSIYTGEGGLDQVNWGNAIQLTKNISVGVNTSYYYGRVEHQSTVIFPDSAYLKNTRLQERDLLHGFRFNLGTQIFIPLAEKSTLGIAATFSPQTVLNAATDYLAITYTGDYNGYESEVDTIANWAGTSGNVTLPYGYGFGLSFEKKNKLLVAADLMFDNWKSFNYLGQSGNFDDKIKASLGVEFIPTSNNLSSYLKLMQYRFGLRYNRMGLQFNNNTIEEYAISIGFGLPLRKSTSVLNLGMEIGQNGTVENSLIQERFFKIALGISIRENWFRKGKYF